MQIRVLAAAVSTALVALAAPAFATPGAAPAAKPPRPGAGAVVQVGTAVRSIAPVGDAMRTHAGGYGDCAGCEASGGTTRVRQGDDLDARVLYVSDGKTADVLVTVPLEGWFAGYQEGARLGITDLRTEAAAALAPRLPAGMTAGNIIVNTNHCHACPTVVGIWAPTNPAYLRHVYDQTLAAIEDAQAAAQPATLTWATGDIGYINDVTVGQGNANEGWPVDGQLSVLQARSVGKHPSVIGTYVSVPAHGNIAHGPSLAELDSEYFGAAARWIEARTGGVGIVAAATLGDQTTPLQHDSTRDPSDPRGTPDGRVDANGNPLGFPVVYDLMDRMGGLVGSTALEALAQRPHVITDGTVAGADSYQVVPITNPVLLALFAGGASSVTTGVVRDQVGAEPADRSLAPPYFAGAGVGVWFTVLRIGSVAIASEPGEAFPHVTQAIRDTITGADAVFVVGNAQDQLGYYYEPWAYPGTQYYSADHFLYNVGPTLAQQNVQGAAVAAALTGFAVTPTVSSYTAAAGNDYTRYFLKAGVQAWAYPRGDNEPAWTGTDVPVTVGVYSNRARGNDELPHDTPLGDQPIPDEQAPTAPAVTVDGVPVTLDRPYNQGRYTGYVTLGLRPGDHVIEARLPGTDASWSSCAHVSRDGRVTNTVAYPDGTGPHPLAFANTTGRCGQAFQAG